MVSIQLHSYSNGTHILHAVQIPHEGTILSTAAQILYCAAKEGRNFARADPAYQLEAHGRAVPWNMDLVKEIQRGVRTCRVLYVHSMLDSELQAADLDSSAFSAVFYLCFDQMQNNLVSQAGQMQTGGTPNDVVPAMNQVACIVFAPMIQYGLMPFLARRRVRFGAIARIGTGFALTAVSMAYAALVQQRIYAAPPCFARPLACAAAAHGAVPNRVSVWLQVPVYAFIAAGEIFAVVTGLEFVYDQAPRDMKTLVQAVAQLMAGFGSVLAVAVAPAARNPWLVAFYAGLAIAMAATTALFLGCFWRPLGSRAAGSAARAAAFDEGIELTDFGHQRRRQPPPRPPRPSRALSGLAGARLALDPACPQQVYYVQEPCRAMFVAPPSRYRP